MDQQSEDVALGYYNLASVISMQEGDLVKAETLVREALRIRTRLYGNDHRHVGLSCNLLASILSFQGNTGNETMELFERSLANDTKNYGPNGSNTAISNHNLGTFYNRLAGQHKNTPRFIEFLRLSKSKYMESVRIYTKIFGPAHPETRQASSILSKVSLTLSELE
jgi:tetratricopeptide (TPR) repeat protein